MNIIGTPRRRVDARAKVTGQPRFADDIMLPRMLHCKLLRSSVPHARLVRVDTARAQAHPGVHLVLTGKDFPVPYGILPVSQDEHALAVDRVRFVGDPVAAVIARDEATAVEALDRIRCPIGLDVGGKTPQEVAISVAAELLGVHHGRVATPAR